MRKTTLIPIALSLIFLSACSTKTQPATVTPVTTTPTTSIQTQTAKTSTQATTTPTTTASTSKTAYTLAEVSKHTTAADCRTTINGKVYNLSPFFGQHPGGDQKLQMLCGIDGSSAFSAKHGNNDKAKAALQTLVIGDLK